MPPLPPSLLDRPIAHRALHGPGVPENSRAAIRAAVAAGYGIEIDLQQSADGEAMVFHDYGLGRLTGKNGPVRLRDAFELTSLQLIGGDEGIPTLREVLEIVDGAVPLLIELKDQDGAMGPNVGTLEAATVAALKGYQGDVALMSFNPHQVVELARLAPDIPQGMATSYFALKDWPILPTKVRRRLRTIPDLESTTASFISHDVRSLDMPRVAELKASGLPILCYTVRSPAAEAKARQIADNITFEGYTA
ncbi:MAG: glycerophosphodiester phosphodiesterase family protein [Paracoccaceae bacterium]|nr:glycerophosphodiester phosphodiesterase family protein [Paracoccaceae bacterium]